ncbi:CHAD domain-containing protein [Actinomadura sp. CNU-125]|uniref:CHAD domain-containing protein n=1 Tax=Actinomadura sp. CNU-125 TaxID=1904961 RepID=UPI000B01186F|nr:CHAD domain-containing protein [Actinomadura sp. CNU-125]
MTAGDAVLGYLAAHLESLIEFDPRARLGENDAVHRMRVATRRLRSTLQAYRPVLDPARTEPLQAELRWLAAVLGEVRDLEVLRMRFADGPSFFVDDLARRERGAYRRMNLALKEPRYFELLDALDALIADPPLGERAQRKARKELPVLVSRVWERMARQYRTIETAEDPDLARHETRKAAKRARYAAELATPVLGAAAKRVAKDAKRIQEVLGEHQDGVLAMERLRAVKGRARTPQDAFALGLLYGREECRAETARDRLAVTWSRTLGPSF